MYWLPYVLLAGLIFFIREIIYKYNCSKNIDISTFTCIWIIIAGILSSIYLFFLYIKNPKIIKNIDNKDIIYALFIAIVSIIGYNLYFYSVKICINPELVRTIFSGLIIILLIIHSIINSAILKIHQYIGIFLILVGMYLAYNKKII